MEKNYFIAALNQEEFYLLSIVARTSLEFLHIIDFSTLKAPCSKTVGASPDKELITDLTVNSCLGISDHHVVSLAYANRA